MALCESEKIRKSLNPIFLSSWVFGVPRVGHKFIYRITYSVILSAIYTATFSTTFDARMQIVGNFNAAVKISYIFSQFVMFAGGIGTIIFWVAKGARAAEVAVMELAELDVELKALGMNDEKNTKKIIRRQVGLISLFFTLWLVIIVMYEYIINLMGVNANQSLFKKLCLAYSSHGPHLIVLFGELVFSTIMYIFYQRFQWINIILRKVSEDHDNFHQAKTYRVLSARSGTNLSNRKITSTELSLVKIERLYKVHQRLCGITEKVASSFSWQLYFAVSVTFSLLVYRLMILYSFAFLPRPKLGVRIGLNVVWVIYYILKFWMITLTCCNTSAEANKLEILLFDIAINEKKYHKMLQEYSVQLFQNRVYLTAGGFFPIDLTLVNALISYITTYILFAVDLWTDLQKKYASGSTKETK